MIRVHERFVAGVLGFGLSLLYPSQASGAELCGDGLFDTESEECDDGNRSPNDGCDPNCRVECDAVGVKATEHTCLHGSNGPYAQLVANPDGQVVVSDVSPPHTYYTVVLPGEPGQNLSRVNFAPSSSSPYAIYMKQRYPVRLLDAEGNEVRVTLEHAISSCADADSITWVQVVEALDSDQTYTVELGPFEESTMSFAFEALGFIGPLFRDADFDGHAARGEAVGLTWCAPPAGYLSAGGADCDDTNPLTFPSAPETCNGENNDCDGRADPEENGLCKEETLGARCGDFQGVTRCGCRSESDCLVGTVCDGTGTCVEASNGAGGAGGETSTDPSGGRRAPADGGAPSGGRAPGPGGSDGVDAGGLPENSEEKDDRAGGQNSGHDRPGGSGCSLGTVPKSPWTMGGLWVLTVLVRRRRSAVRRVAARIAVAALAVVAWPSAAQADIPEDCQGLGDALVEHSCFHANLGPFEARVPTPGSQATAETPNVNPVHTEYRVLLEQGDSSLTYKPEAKPERSGMFAFFTTYDVPLTVTSDREGPREVLFRSTDTGCDALPLARVYELSEEVYTLTFTSEKPGEVALVIEYVDDFLIRNGVDRDGDGYGDPTDFVMSVCTPLEGYAANSSDCDDQNSGIHPGADELCGDDVDQNCNGLVDDTKLSCWVGSGACRAQGTLVCASEGKATCDVTEGEATPEVCNGADDDCDGKIDEESDLCGDPVRPRCVRRGFTASCGCQFDSDCAGAADAPSDVCDTATGECQFVGPGSSGGADSGTGGTPSLGGEAESGAGGVSEAGCSCRTGTRMSRSDAKLLSIVAGWSLLAARACRRSQKDRTGSEDR
jgi:cysteine-rich repeat protein